MRLSSVRCLFKSFCSNQKCRTVGLQVYSIYFERWKNNGWLSTEASIFWQCNMLCLSRRRNMIRTTQNDVVLITLFFSSEIYINSSHILQKVSTLERRKTKKENSLFLFLFKLKIISTTIFALLPSLFLSHFPSYTVVTSFLYNVHSLWINNTTHILLNKLYETQNIPGK